ncbi:hypothetical protein BDQ17DRAFT_1167113, partial [Cyathus striatus]
TPRWLRTPDELHHTMHSSIVFAVDDEEIARSLLKIGKLAAFSRFCMLRPFQDHPPVLQCTNCWGWDHKANNCKVLTRCQLCSETHSEDQHKTVQCEWCMELLQTNGDTVMQGMDCTHNLKCANC